MPRFEGSLCKTLSGEYSVPIDDKFRVGIPASLDTGENGYYVLQVGKKVFLYPQTLYDKLLRECAKLSEFNKERDRYVRAKYRKLDSTGRIILRGVGLESRSLVTVVGNINCIFVEQN